MDTFANTSPLEVDKFSVIGDKVAVRTPVPTTWLWTRIKNESSSGSSNEIPDIWIVAPLIVDWAIWGNAITNLSLAGFNIEYNITTIAITPMIMPARR
jgi:hypothetical protein